MNMQSYFNDDTRRVRSLRETYRYLIRSAGKQKPKLMLGLTLMFLSAALFGGSIATLYPFFLDLENNGAFGPYPALLTVLLIVSIGLRVAAEYYDTNGYSQRAISEWRERLGDKLRRISLSVLSGFRAGELNAVLIQSVNEAAGYAFSLMTMVIYAATIPLATAFVLLFFDWRFSAVILVVFPLIIPLYLWRRKAFRRGFSILAEANEKLKGEAVEFIQGLDVLKSTGQTENKQNQFKRVAADVAVIQRIGTKKGEYPNLIITSATQFGFIIMLIFGLIWVQTGTASWLILAAVMVMIARVSDALNFFVQMSSLLEIFVISCEKLEKVMKLPELTEKQAEKMPDNYRIRYQNVSFGYHEQQPILRHINLDIVPNTVNAFVGASGCGKTTLLRLLLRYADPQQGSVSIGGTDIRELSQNQLMSLISAVFQEVYLFQDSILNNIRMAKPEATDEMVIAAAEQAQCHQFIQALPQGYQTQIADIGANLSGGEKQRIAIARAILKDAPILILDEPTAALDTQNELAVQRALEALVKNKTILIIAHRLSTIANADCIYVIADGGIAEQGCHAQLITQNGLYRTFWQYQQEMNDDN
ncbi:ABC transporter ATP-binding protein [Bisgaard Taxon 10/6]|uniref:ABC transporter ATP-binding protein n=1 Tax=Exercitatus varius TaxID=67857 RepID=A0ABT6EUF4_9PAST|nr:ABC transporter ATP-binding protein [Exercitatus varius]MDG2946474.1 ABC transporter ATP-binding protein [Exercitatus varius]